MHISCRRHLTDHGWLPGMRQTLSPLLIMILNNIRILRSIGIGNGQPPPYPPTNRVITMACPSLWHGLSGPGPGVII